MSPDFTRKAHPPLDREAGVAPSLKEGKGHTLSLNEMEGVPPYLKGGQATSFLKGGKGHTLSFNGVERWSPDLKGRRDTLSFNRDGEVLTLP